MKQQIRDAVYGVSERFIDDFIFIWKKIENHSIVFDTLGADFVSETLKKILKEKNATIDVESVRVFQSSLFERANMKSLLAQHIDHMKAFHTKLSKEVPAERLNGVMNFYLIIAYPNATTEEVKIVLVTIIRVAIIQSRQKI